MQQQKHITTTLTELRSLGYKHEGITFTDVVAVMQGRINPMRNMEKEVLIPNLSLTIQHVANLYGARMEVDKVTLRECIDLVQQEFSTLALTEIVQAYRLWAAKKFEALEMYGGQFNVTQMARVLSGYKAYRFEINQALARKKHQDEAEERAKQAAQRRVIEKENERRAFPAAVANAKSTGRFPLVTNIPVRWYELADARGWIVFADGEKLEYWTRAQKAVTTERANKKVKGFVSARNLEKTREERDRVAAIYRAKQMIVFEKVLGRTVPESETPPQRASADADWFAKAEVEIAEIMRDEM